YILLLHKGFAAEKEDGSVFGCCYSPVVYVGIMALVVSSDYAWSLVTEVAWNRGTKNRPGFPGLFACW
ncbi:hypothetical protein, partial [Aquisalimonas sp.]|uniref:hypothetical protein n=1 Tax=Aquisalimonas sp. TaxID=1872621 RepID=UPI0025C62921